jgi:uncharacterized protein (TIGR03790 family)
MGLSAQEDSAMCHVAEKLRSRCARQIRIGLAIMALMVPSERTLALEPQEILVIANGHIAESVEIARYYCQAREVPRTNILSLPLGPKLSETISRRDYERLLVEPIREEFDTGQLIGKIKCLLTVYGVPIKVGPRGPLTEQADARQKLQAAAEQVKTKIEQLKQGGSTASSEYKQTNRQLTQLQGAIARIDGGQSHASVDSELSMVLFDSYELYQWQPNALKKDADDFLGLASRTLMVSRLDGPDYGIVKGLIDKAMAAEKAGLRGTACIDSRGIQGKSLYGQYDQSLRDLAMFIREETDMPVHEEQTGTLFAPGTCPQTALYCGWYSVGRYVDAFDFVDGAIGYHIASFEAANLRDPNSSHWCPAMLKDGITATLGPVAEPYLHAFPEPRAFFAELCEGRCLVEAYYHTNPLNSWQLLLIGDPLYRPFKKLSQS